MLYYLRMDRISDLIPKVLHKKGLQHHAAASHVVFVATQWISQNRPQLKDLYTVQSYCDGELRIDVQNSIAAQELSQITEKLTVHIQEEIGIHIASIRITRCT